jgi:hypothetical protein
MLKSVTPSHRGLEVPRDDIWGPRAGMMDFDEYEIYFTSETGFFFYFHECEKRVKIKILPRE